MEPWAKIEILAMRNFLPHLSGGEMKVWMAYRLRADKNGECWPGLDVLAKDTGLSVGRVSRHRNALVRKGALVRMGTSRTEGGTFGSPRVRVCIPNRMPKTPCGENTVRRNNRAAKDSSTVCRKRQAPYGENGILSSSTQVEPRSKKKRRYDTPEAKTASEGASVSTPSTPRMEGNSTPTPVVAAQLAFEQFAERCDKQEAFQLLLWILYGAARSQQVPQTTQYYLAAGENFHAQHEENAEQVLENSVERFRKHAGSFIKQRCPELQAWLEATWKELQTEST